MGIWIAFEEGTKLSAFSQVYLEKNKVCGMPVSGSNGFGQVLKKCDSPEAAKALMVAIVATIRDCRNSLPFFEIR